MTPYLYQPLHDCSHAICVALRDFLRGVKWSSTGQGFKRVVCEWESPEQQHEYPSLVIMPIKHGDFTNTTPHLMEETRIPEEGPGHVLLKDAEYVANVDLQIVATNAPMRSCCKRAVYDALRGDGSDGTYDLSIPAATYYGGVVNVAVFPISERNEDTAKEIGGRYRTGYVTVQARIPVVRVLGVVDLLPRFVFEVDNQEVS